MPDSTIIETPRLALRELRMSDLDFVAEMLADRQVMRYWPRTQDRAEARLWIWRHQDRCAQHGHSYWLAIDKASGRPVGQAGLLMHNIDGVLEPGIGYMLHAPYWGRGFATEAARAIIHWAFNARAYPRVLCLIRPQNLPSLQVAMRLPLMLERCIVYFGFDHLLFSASRAAGDVRTHPARGGSAATG